MTQKKKTSGLAIAALVCGLFCWPVGLILGILALNQINKSNGELGGTGLAIGGMVAGAMVGIIGILAAIAIPNFIRYQLRSKTSEARATLMSIRVNQESFMMQNDFYSNAVATGGAGGTVKVPWDGEACPAGCPGDAAQCTQFDCIGFKPFGATYYTYECKASGKDFTCAAVADLDGDGRPGVFVYGTNSGGGPMTAAPMPGIATAAGCNGPAPANEVFDCNRGDF